MGGALLTKSSLQLKCKRHGEKGKSQRERELCSEKNKDEVRDKEKKSEEKVGALSTK